MKKFIALLFLVLLCSFAWAQTPTTIHVGSDYNKLYPVTFLGDGWNNNVASEFTIVRWSIHPDDFRKGSVTEKLNYHTNNLGHRSEFIDAFIYSSLNTNPLLAGWARCFSSKC